MPLLVPFVYLSSPINTVLLMLFPILPGCVKQAKTNNLWEARASDKPIKLAGHVKQWVWWWSECRFLRGVFFHQSTLVGIFKFCPKLMMPFFIINTVLVSFQVTFLNKFILKKVFILFGKSFYVI